MPFIGLQMATWQSSGTGAKKQSLTKPSQLPSELQVAPWTHKSPGSQLAPTMDGVEPQLLLPSSQVISWHVAASIPQSFGGPPTQRPWSSQVSLVVQNMPSSHGVPASGTTTH